MAALVNDPIDQIQLEAIGAELSFFLVRMCRRKSAWRCLSKCAARARVPGVRPGSARRVARPVPPELMDGLLQAIDDENAKVRIEAIYALGTIARPPLPDAGCRAARQGTGSLRSGYPRRRGACRWRGST